MVTCSRTQRGREGGREGGLTYLDVELGGVLGRHLLQALLEQVPGSLQLVARVPREGREGGGEGW